MEYAVVMRRRVQVSLNSFERERLDVWAKAHGWTKSQAVRQAIRLATKRPTDDPILDLIGAFDGFPADASTRVDHYLNQADLAERRAKARKQRERSRGTPR
jgi:hypothetical protein